MGRVTVSQAAPGRMRSSSPLSDQLVIDLQAEEKPLRHAEIAREAQVEFGVHRTRAVDHLVEARSLDVDGTGERLSRKAERLHEFKDQNFAGMAVVQPVRINGSR
jgi:hypothetical protein